MKHVAHLVTGSLAFALGLTIGYLAGIREGAALALHDVHVTIRRMMRRPRSER